MTKNKLLLTAVITTIISINAHAFSLPSADAVKNKAAIANCLATEAQSMLAKGALTAANKEAAVKEIVAICATKLSMSDSDPVTINLATSVVEKLLK